MEGSSFVKNKFKRSSRKRKFNKLLICIIFIILSTILFLYIRDFNKKLNKNFENIIDLNHNLFKKIQNLETIIKQKENSYIISNSDVTTNNNNNVAINKINSLNEEFDEKLNQKYKENQHHFCQSNDLFTDIEIENKISKVHAHLNNISFYMFVYKSGDYVSDSISGSGSWERDQTNKVINCLNYYSNKKQLSKNEITVLDIGANVGWYSFYLANEGYELFSYEVSHFNTYILKKNFCLNENVNITIINKGIGLQQEKCLLHHPSINIGNAVILCGENVNIAKRNKNLTEEVEFTKLSNYFSFLSKKNIAFIKLDVEGSEGKVIESGIEFISKYHVPFLLVEFRNDYLKMQGTDPRKFLEMFENNGYVFSTVSFFPQNYMSIEALLEIKSTDLYIVYKNILE